LSTLTLIIAANSIVLTQLLTITVISRVALETRTFPECLLPVATAGEVCHSECFTVEPQLVLHTEVVFCGRGNQLVDHHMSGLLAVLSEIACFTLTFVDDLVQFVSLASTLAVLTVESALYEFTLRAIEVLNALTFEGFHPLVLGGDYEVCIGLTFIHENYSPSVLTLQFV